MPNNYHKLEDLTITPKIHQILNLKTKDHENKDILLKTNNEKHIKIDYT